MRELLCHHTQALVSFIFIHRQRKLKVRHRTALQMTDLQKMLISQLRQVAYTKVKVLIGKG